MVDKTVKKSKKNKIKPDSYVRKTGKTTEIILH